MLKKNFILTLVLCVAATFVHGQTTSSTTIAFNAEQIMDKVGMQKLFDLFDKSKASSDPAKKENNKRVQKAIAALYGAGIDFSKKIWMVQKQKIPADFSAGNFAGFEQPTFTLIIPVANRQVFEEQLSVLARGDLQFSKRGNVSYVIKNKALFVLTDKEFFIHNLPEKLSWLFDEVEMYGTPVKADTVKREKRVYDDVLLSQTEEKKSFTEVDKLLPTGKVQRIYFYKEPKYDDPAMIAMDTAVLAPPREEMVDSLAPAVDTAAVIVRDEEVKADTMTYTKYLNDSTEIHYQYIPYTEAERDAYTAQQELKRIADREQEAFKFIDSCQSFVPYANISAAGVKMLQSKDDIVMYSTASNLSGPFKQLSSVFNKSLSSVAPTALLNQSTNSFMSVNFNNGNMQMKIYSDSVKNEYDKLYKPVTDFWPKELGDGKMGRIRFNLDAGLLTQMIAKYLEIMKPYHLYNHSKEDSFINMKWEEMFTGEIAASFITPVAKKDKQSPRMLVAFRVNDTKLAVQNLNTLASDKLRSTKSYRFDVNGKYLLFDTEGGIGAKPIQVVPTAIAPKLGTNYGEVLIDLRALITNATRQSKRNTKDFKMFTQFFNTISMVADKNETEGYVVDMKIDMGDKSTNALYNLIKLLSDKDTVKKKTK